MDKKKPTTMYAAITPTEMLTMIGDFADGLLYHMREQGMVDDVQLNEAFKRMMTLFDDMKIEGRLSIIVMLLGAVTTYEYGIEQESQKCRYLN